MSFSHFILRSLFEMYFMECMNVAMIFYSKFNTDFYSILPGRKLLGEVWRSVIREEVWRIWPSLSLSSLRFWRSLASSLGAKAVSTRFRTSFVVHSFVGRSDNLCVGRLDVKLLTPSCRDDKVVGVSWAEPKDRKHE